LQYSTEFHKNSGFHRKLSISQALLQLQNRAIAIAFNTAPCTTLLTESRVMSNSEAGSQLVTWSTRHSPKSYDELTGGWNTVLWRVDWRLKLRAVTAVSS